MRREAARGRKMAMRILCAHPAFRVLEMSLSQLGEKQIAPDEALNDRSLLSISQWWTDKNYFAWVQGNAAETGHHTQLPGNSPGRGIVTQGMRMDLLADTRTLGGIFAGIPDGLGADGMMGGVPAPARE